MWNYNIFEHLTIVYTCVNIQYSSNIIYRVYCIVYCTPGPEKIPVFSDPAPGKS